MKQKKTTPKVNLPKNGSVASRFFKRTIDILMTEGGPLPAKSMWYWGLTRDEVNGMFADKDVWIAKREIERMKQRQIIKDRRRGTEAYYILTDSGKTLLLRQMIKAIKKKLPKNTYCYVVFDIPESARHARHVLTQVLHDAEFQFVQRSVWATGLDVTDVVLELIRHSGMTKWVKVVVGRQYD